MPANCDPCPGKRKAVLGVKSDYNRSRGSSLTRLVTLLFVLLHHRAGGDLFGAPAISAALLRGFLDVFVLPLFLRTYGLQMLFSWHIE
jgi:hypothetical protein